MASVEVVVEHEYSSKEEDELTIKPGDIITNVNMLDGGWWEGDLNGRRGMFPDNFVKEVKKDVKVTKEPRKDPKKPGGHVAELANKLGQGGIKMGPPGPRVIKRGEPGKRKVRAKVAYSYTPENEDEIALEAGAVIEILKQEEEGWWEGSVDGKVGMFPSNFVELVDEDGTVSSPQGAPEEDNSGHTVEIAGKKVKGIGLGNIFGGGPIKLRSAADRSKKPPDEVVSPRAENLPHLPAKEELNHAPAKDPSPEHGKDVPPANTQSNRISMKKAPPPVPKEPPTVQAKDGRDLKYSAKQPQPSRNNKVERAKVLFSYQAENEDELTIDEGEVIYILKKDLEDSGWWKGELNGRQGVFPDNFVELLPPEEPLKPKKPPPPVVPASSAKTKPLDRALPPDPAKHKEKEDAEPSPAEETEPSVTIQPIGKQRFMSQRAKEPAISWNKSQVARAYSLNDKPAKPSGTAIHKKPSVPPPVSKKPAKPADLKLIAQTDDQKVQESQKTESELDGVEATTEKLTHPTANRVRAPTRRLPTTHNSRENSQVVEDPTSSDPVPGAPGPAAAPEPTPPPKADNVKRSSKRAAPVPKPEVPKPEVPKPEVLKPEVPKPEEPAIMIVDVAEDPVEQASPRRDSRRLSKRSSIPKVEPKDDGSVVNGVAEPTDLSPRRRQLRRKRSSSVSKVDVVMEEVSRRLQQHLDSSQEAEAPVPPLRPTRFKRHSVAASLDVERHEVKPQASEGGEPSPSQTRIIRKGALRAQSQPATIREETLSDGGTPEEDKIHYGRRKSARRCSMPNLRFEDIWVLDLDAKPGPVIVGMPPRVAGSVSPPPAGPQLIKPTSPRSHQDVTVNGADMSSRVAHLEHQLQQLKATTVPKSDYEALLQEVSTLKDTINHVKASCNKRLLEVMSEIDEEKKVRLTMQVEIDRVKKLVTS